MSSTFAERLEEVQQAHGVTIEVTGGGRGWTAKALLPDKTYAVKADSKLGVLSLMDNSLQEFDLERPDDMSDAEFERCIGECVNSKAPYCRCKCGGANHGIGHEKRGFAAVIEPKRCLCGCGGTTQRLFVPGHDARYHARQALEARAKAAGRTVAEQVAADKASKNAARKARRAARKEGVPAPGKSALSDG